MRIDVQCTFGILKNRFGILKSVNLLYRVDVTDQIWKTYCVLHNTLFHIDGFAEEWRGGLGILDIDHSCALTFSL